MVLNCFCTLFDKFYFYNAVPHRTHSQTTYNVISIVIADILRIKINKNYIPEPE